MLEFLLGENVDHEYISKGIHTIKKHCFIILHQEECVQGVRFERTYSYETGFLIRNSDSPETVV